MSDVAVEQVLGGRIAYRRRLDSGHSEEPGGVPLAMPMGAERRLKPWI
jgi:hypothetical protein